MILRCIPNRQLPIDKNELASTVPGDTSIVARPFDRFFNHGDPNAANIDWDDPTLVVQEKLDGTLAIVYHDDIQNAWCMATRSVPDADLPFVSFGKEMTFRQLFDLGLVNSTRINTLEEFMDGVREDVTFCFELTSPYNRIVVDYKQPGITFIGARNRSSGWEYSYAEILELIPDDLRKFFPRPAKTWPCNTLEQVHAALTQLEPTEGEGVVVVNSRFERLKIKSVAWLAANKVKSTCTTERALLSLILGEKVDDVMAILPEDVQARVPLLKTALVRLCATIDTAQREFLAASEGSRKAYALLVTGSGLWTTPLFQLLGNTRNNVDKSPPHGTMEWIMSRRNDDGSWDDAFLQHVVEELKRVNVS